MQADSQRRDSLTVTYRKRKNDMKVRKIICPILGLLILCLYVVALLPSVLGRVILIIPSALANFMDEDSTPQWERDLASKLGDLYDDYIAL